MLLLVGNGDQDTYADFDDLKIFNRTYSANEIKFEMHNNL